MNARCIFKPRGLVSAAISITPRLERCKPELTASPCMQVNDLRAQLGSAAVPCPQMDIGSSFTTIVSKALNIYGFFPYNTDVNFLLGETSHA